MEAMRRELVWVERKDFWGWGCSKCGWVFKIAGPPSANGWTDEEALQQRRHKDFASHVCAEHPIVKKPKS